jgi:hypothetical protein
VQQWYGNVSFSGFSFDYGGMAGASSSYPPLIDSPPPKNPQNVEKNEAEAGGGGEKYQLKLLFNVQFSLKKPDCPILPSRIFIYLFTSL